MPEPVTVRSNAKVNLALRITGRTEQGYHTLSTLFQEIDLHDRITFKQAEQFSFSTSDQNLPENESNLCVAAYNIIKEYTDSPVPCQIFLDKNIPVGTGLGGGSSNAAAVLKYLNKFWKIGLSDQKLMQIGKKLGADVPFFINGGTQIGEGIGNILQPVKLKLNFKILCILPDFQISTAKAYAKFSLTNQKEKFNFDRLILNGVPNWKLFENQFEEVITQSYPEISDMKQKLLSGGAEYAGLSGSGSTVIGIFPLDADLKELRQSIDYITVITNPMIN